MVLPAGIHQFFLIARAEQRAKGAPPVAWWLDDYFKWLGPPYYLALQSAVAIYGSTPQAIQTTQVMTDSPWRLITVGRLRIQFFVKRLIEFTPTRRDLLAHQAYVPWPTQQQVEQNLLLCRSIAALFSDKFLQSQIAMRGGTLAI